MTDQEFDGILQKKLSEIKPLAADAGHAGQVMQNLHKDQNRRIPKPFRYAAYALCFGLGMISHFSIQTWVFPISKNEKPALLPGHSSPETTNQTAPEENMTHGIVREIVKRQEKGFEFGTSKETLKKSGTVVREVDVAKVQQSSSRMAGSMQGKRLQLPAPILSENNIKMASPTLPVHELSLAKGNLADSILYEGSEDLIKLLPGAKAHLFAQEAGFRMKNPGIMPSGSSPALRWSGGVMAGGSHELLSSGLLVGVGWNRFSLMTGIRLSMGLSRHFRSGDDFRDNYADGGSILDDPSLPVSSEIGSLRHHNTSWALPIYLQYKVPVYRGFSAILTSGIEIGLNESHMIKYRLFGSEEDRFYSSVRNLQAMNIIAGAGLMWEKGRYSWQVLPVGRGATSEIREGRHRPLNFEVQMNGFYQF